MATLKTIRVVVGATQQWAKVLFNSELQEYRVKFYKHAEWQSKADYFTDDRDDAIGTAELWAGIK